MLFHRISRNLISSYVLFFMSFAAVYALTPIYVRTLGKTLFGFWSVLLSIIAYLSILDSGLALYLTKTVSEFESRSNNNLKRLALSSTFTIYLALCVVVILIAAVAGLFKPDFFVIPDAASDSITLLFVLLALHLSFSYLSKFFASLCMGYQDVANPNYISVISVILQATLAFGLLAAGCGLWALVISYTVSSAVNCTLKFLYCSNRYGPLTIRPYLPEPKTVFPIVKFSSAICLTTVGGQIILNTDNILIAKLLSYDQVANYAINFQIILSLSVLFQKLPDILFPTYVSLDLNRDKTSLKQAFIESSFFSLIGYTGFSLHYALFADHFFAYWIDSSHFVGNSIAWIILAFFFCQTYIHNHAVFLLSRARLRKIVKMNIVEAISNVVFSIALAQSYGIVGIATGSLLANLVTNFIYLPRQLEKEIALSCRDQLKKIVAPAVIPFAIVFSIGYAVKVHAAPFSIASIIGLLSLYSILYLIFVGVMIGKNRREFYYHYIKKLLTLTQAQPLR
jgi:O-antigen/teichoic acid export membrane protein